MFGMHYLAEIRRVVCATPVVKHWLEFEMDLLIEIDPRETVHQVKERRK